MGALFPAFLLLLSAGSPCFGDLVKDAPTRFVRGVFEVPQAPSGIPVIYDRYFPLIFEFALPKWDVETMKIQFWKDHNNCTETDHYSDGYPCPIMYHMNTLIEAFVGNMTLWKNLFLDDPLQKHVEQEEGNPDFSLPLIFTKNNSSGFLDQDYYCHKIVPHFATFQTSGVNLNSYYALFEKCGNEMIKTKVNLTSTSLKLEDLYHSAFSSFVSDYWDKLSPVGRQASMLNMWTSLETTLLLHQFMETQKWAEAVQSCQKGQVPWSLVDHDLLTDTIRQHHVLEHQLAIPVSEMSKYFKLPLTDCVFLGSDTLIVRILIPYKTHSSPTADDGIISKLNGQQHNRYRLIKFEPIVFHSSSAFCWIDEIRDQRFVVDNLHSGDLHLTSCSDNQGQELCRVPVNYFSSHDAASPCAQALFNDDEEGIVASCSLKCSPLEKRHLNYKYFNFAHTLEDNILFSWAAEEKLKVTCPNPKGPALEITREEFTAWNLTLPCGCEIRAKPSVHLEIAEPCQKLLVVERIKPYHWRNLTTAREGEPLRRVTVTPTTADSKDPFCPCEATNGNGTADIHLILIWLVLLALLSVLCVLSYFVFQLRKWRQHELFKESRLIYSNVRDDTISNRGREDFPLEQHQGNHNRY